MGAVWITGLLCFRGPRKVYLMTKQGMYKDRNKFEVTGSAILDPKPKTYET